MVRWRMAWVQVVMEVVDASERLGVVAGVVVDAVVGSWANMSATTGIAYTQIKWRRDRSSNGVQGGSEREMHVA